MSTQGLASAQYDFYSAVRTHVHSNGLAMMPTAALFPQYANVVALHGGLDYDVVVASVSKRGDMPQVPSPIVTNQNRIFLRGGRWGNFPITDVAGVRTYTLGVWYIFGILSPEGLASEFMLGKLPFPGLTASDESAPMTAFRVDLINQMPTQTLLPILSLPTFLNPIRADG